MSISYQTVSPSAKTFANIGNCAALLETPQAHYDRLHEDARGVVITWTKLSAKGRWKKLTPGSAGIPELLGAHLGEKDRYISVNEFYSWRLVCQLKSLRACFIDIDGCTDIDWCLQCVAMAQMPAPTFVVLSGRGVHLYWEIDAVPAKALPVWQQIQDGLSKALVAQGLPVDVGAKDCTRVLRLVGSVNSKSATTVVGRILTGWRWDIHTLADEVLGCRSDKENATKLVKAVAADRLRDEQLERGLELDIERESACVRDFRAAQLRKGITPGTTPRGARKGSIYGWWQLVYQDMIKIGDNLGGVPKGHRDTYLFLYAVALSWFAGAEALEAEVQMVAKKVMPEMKASAVKKAIEPNLTRIKAVLEKKTVTWNGQERDPRYWYKRETLFGLLSPIIPKDMYPELRALVPASLIAERKGERDSKRHKDKNTGQGVRQGNVDKAARARLMRDEGLSQRGIAKSLSVAQSTVQGWLKK